MGQLRPFEAYANTTGVSIITTPCTLVALDGNYRVGVANQYLQIFDKASAPATNDIPIKSFLLSTAGPINLPSIFEIQGPINLTLGLAVGMSTDPVKYAAATATYDVFGDTEEWETQISGLTTGATQTGVNALDYIIWTDANGPRYLYELTFTNNEGVPTYPMIFTQTTTPSPGTRPFLQFPVVANGATVKLKFGYGGLSPMDHSSNLVTRDGCHFILSDTPGTYGSDTLTINASTSVIAKYKISGQTS